MAGVITLLPLWGMHGLLLSVSRLDGFACASFICLCRSMCVALTVPCTIAMCNVCAGSYSRPVYARPDGTAENKVDSGGVGSGVLQRSTALVRRRRDARLLPVTTCPSPPCVANNICTGRACGDGKRSWASAAVYSSMAGDQSVSVHLHRL